MARPQARPRFLDEKAADVHLAFIDLLGFKSRVLADFDGARRAFEVFLDATSETTGLWEKFSEGALVHLSVFSDSILAMCDQETLTRKPGPPNAKGALALRQVIDASAVIQAGAMRAGFLTRGCIARGKHVAAPGALGSRLVISEPLVRAVEGAGASGSPPWVVLDSSVPESEIELLVKNVPTDLVQREGRWVVNPFATPARIIMAETTLRQMQTRYAGTRHAAKYDWMLELLDDVKANPGPRLMKPAPR